MREDVERMREAIAKEYNIGLFRRYSEPEAAHFLQIDLSTLKRMRRAGKTPYVSLGERQIRYLGIHIVDLIAFGDKWRDIQNESSSAEITGSLNAKEAPHGAVLGLTQRHDRPNEFQLAQTILSRPRSS